MATNTDDIEATATNAVELATELTIAWLGNHNNRVSADDVPAFLQKMHQTINDLSGATSGDVVGHAEPETFEPKVTVRKSLASPDHIISMVDGKPYKTLRRHLATNGLTPEQYRERYKLKPDYPMVAPSYSESRRAMAKRIGLGRKPKATSDETTPETAAPAKTAAPRGRRTKKADA